MKIVLDANIVVSGLLQSQGNPAQVLTLALAGAVQVCHDERILDELTPSQNSFYCVIILLPVATNQLKAQDIECAARRTTVFGSDQRESAQDSQGLPCLCVERRRPGRFVSG